MNVDAIREICYSGRFIASNCFSIYGGIRMKTLVYWGIGGVGKGCIEYFPEKIPQFIIDSNCADKEYQGILICNPESITTWKELFIVITVADSSQIKNFLNSKGLQENDDFQDYTSFFHIYEKPKDNIARLKKVISLNSELVKRTLLIIPVFSARKSEVLTNFIRKYAKLEKCVLLMSWRIMTEVMATDKMGFPVFGLARMSGRDAGNEENHEGMLEITDLSYEEQKWLEDIFDRKNTKDNQESIWNLQQKYQYWKNIVTIFQPKHMVFWGNWESDSYIVGHLCGKYDIHCVYMEHGWLPGTYYLDPKGISGQGECTKKSNPKMLVDKEKISEIKNYIITNKLDSRIFKYTVWDEEKLKEIDATKKTVFLVGMDDFGMGINPKTAYWNEYVSSVVSSTMEAYEYVKEICVRHNWNFIFKPHPGKNNIIDSHSDALIFRDIQIDRLIEKANVVISIASAVNYKVLLYKKPLVQIGITCLSGKGCCYEVNCKEQIEDNIINALAYGMTEEQINNFDIHLSVMLDNYLWDDLSERDVRYGLGLEKNFPFR